MKRSTAQGIMGIGAALLGAAAIFGLYLSKQADPEAAFAALFTGSAPAPVAEAQATAPEAVEADEDTEVAAAPPPKTALWRWFPAARGAWVRTDYLEVEAAQAVLTRLSGDAAGSGGTPAEAAAAVFSDGRRQVAVYLARDAAPVAPAGAPEVAVGDLVLRGTVAGGRIDLHADGVEGVTIRIVGRADQRALERLLDDPGFAALQPR